MKLKTKIVALASSAALFVGVAFGVGLSLGKANAEEWTATATEWQWDESYEFGSNFQVPAYTVTVGGETVGATSVVTLPDGTTTTSASLTLNQAGIYTISYFANQNGKEYSKTVQFEVGYKAYYVTGASSSVEYGVYTGYDAADPLYASYKHDGLLVKLANGDKLEFAHLLDVTQLTSAEALVKGFITPLAFNVADFDKLIVTLTDAADPSVYLQIDLNRWSKSGGENGSGKTHSFVSAGGNGQDMVGFEEGKGLHVNDNVGTPLPCTFVAAHYKNANGTLGAYWSGVEVVPVSPSKYPFSLAYDAGLNSVFAGGLMVSDLDSAEYYSSLWRGFPSGQARMSICASGYQGATANFCLTEVFGLEELSNNAFSEAGIPVITVDTEYEKMPNAKIGTAYKVPVATAYDDYSGVCEVETRVWYNYATERPVSITVKDGKFIPDRNGYYSIVYTAKDFFGNTATKTLSVLAVKEIPELTVENPVSVPTTATLGYKVSVAAPTIAGGTGNVTCVITAVGPESSYTVTDGFIPDVAGTWTVTYTVTDYIDTVASCSFDVEATPGDKPVIDSTLVLPKVYLNGVSYLLPTIYADDYSSGRKVSSLCDVKVEYTDRTETLKAGDTFVPLVSNNGEKVKITYYSGNTSLETMEVPVVIVKNGNDVYVKNYIYGENIEITDKDENGKNLKGLQISATTAGDIAWTFANPQVAELFSVKLSSLKGKTMYKGMTVNLTDSNNPEQSATLYIKVGSSSVTVYNDSFEAEIQTSLAVDTIFSVSYETGKFKFDNVNVAINSYDNGEAFNGFSSNKVYATITMTEAARGSAYMLLEVSGSATTYRNKDYGKPLFTILGDSGGSYSFGDSYTLAPAMAGDTFAPETSLKVTVIDPEGNVVSDKNGLKLEGVDASQAYTISLNKYGLYNIQYAATEENWVGNSDEFTNYVYVMDEEAPVITITSEYTKTAKVGQVIILPTFTVSDNITEEAKITIDRFVQNPTGRLVRIPYVSNSVKATYEGTYYFRIMAKDEYGNVATVTLEVIVTK